MWLFLVLILGTLFILLELSLERIILWLERRNTIKSRSTEWFGNDTLQLQRMAHEELGLGDWEGCHGKDIPVTKKGQLLGIFSTADPAHPRLVNPNEKPADHGSGTSGSETANESHPNVPSQEDSHGSVGHDSTGHSSTDHNSVDHGHTSTSPVEHQGNDRPQSVGASPLEGWAATACELSEQHTLPQNETSANSSNVSPTQPDAIAVP